MKLVTLVLPVYAKGINRGKNPECSHNAGRLQPIVETLSYIIDKLRMHANQIVQMNK